MTPSTHDLNKLLADVAGVEVRHPADWGQPVRYESENLLWMYRIPSTDISIGDKKFPVAYLYWNPCTDHNQMALVKAALQDQWTFRTSWNHHAKKWSVWIGKEEDYMGALDGWMINDPEELMAFALAVWEMKHDHT